jgi:hypothetical protein
MARFGLTGGAGLVREVVPCGFGTVFEPGSTLRRFCRSGRTCMNTSIYFWEQSLMNISYFVCSGVNILEAKGSEFCYGRKVYFK